MRASTLLALLLIAAVFLGGAGRVYAPAREPGRSGHPTGGTRVESIGRAADDVPEAAAPVPGFPLFLRALPPRSGAPAPVHPGEPAWPLPLVDGVPRRDVLLTFDDGPDLEVTPLVLAELDRRGLKAIFFVQGSHLIGERTADRARRRLVRTLVEHGHMVGNHTLSHKDVCLQRDALEREIDDNQEVLTAATGIRPVLFRSPYGARCRALDEALAARGLINVGWNVDPQEWRGDDPAAIAATVAAQLRALPGRGIVLLHDTKRATVRALPRILDTIAALSSPSAARPGQPGPAPPLRVVDYSVFLPRPSLPDLGVERLLGQLLGALVLLPGARHI